MINRRTIVKRETRGRFFERVVGAGFSGKLGMKLRELATGYAAVEMFVQKDDVNMFGTVHGGVIFALMDEAFQISCNAHGTEAVALHVSVNYHRPAYGGRTLRAESREVSRSKKIAAYDIKALDDDGSLIASCQALAYVKSNPHPFRNEDPEQSE
jgi:acyl-CoA thioesterase